MAQKILKIIESGNSPPFYLTRPLIRNGHDLVMITIVKSKRKAKIRGKKEMEQFGESPNLTRPSEAVTSDTFHYVLFLHILNNATVD